MEARHMQNDRLALHLAVLAAIAVVIAIGAVLAISFQKLSMPQAALLAPLALTAAGAGASAVLILIDDQTDESIELNSHWGGLGGGLGGWSLSRPAALSLIMLLAVLAMLAIAATKAPAPDTGGTATAPPKTSPP